MNCSISRNPFLSRAGFNIRDYLEEEELGDLICRNPFLSRAGFNKLRLLGCILQFQFVAIPFYLGQVSTVSNLLSQFFILVFVAIPFYLGQVSTKIKNKKLKEGLVLSSRNPFLSRAGFNFKKRDWFYLEPIPLSQSLFI